MAKRSADAAGLGASSAKRATTSYNSGYDGASSASYTPTIAGYDTYASSSYSYTPQAPSATGPAFPASFVGPAAPPTFLSQEPAPKPKKSKKGKAPAVDEKKGFIRAAGGEIWKDEQLAEWDENDFRIFVGDLGNECSDEILTAAFRKYPSFQKAKIIRDKHTSKPKGYGFVSFKDPADFTKAMREMNGKYVGNRPIKLRKSNWKERNLENRDKDEVKRQRNLKNTQIAA